MFEQNSKQQRDVSFFDEVIMYSKWDLFHDARSVERWDITIHEPLTDKCVMFILYLQLPSLRSCHVCHLRRFFASAYWSVARQGVPEMLQIFDAMKSTDIQFSGAYALPAMYFSFPEI